MEEGDNLNTTELIALELEERAGAEKLATLGRKTRGHEHKLVVVDTFSSVIRLRQMLFQQIP
jgi:hypothetical protein